MAPETPKGVSSRLLTMKFMQRAAASASSSGSPDTDVPSSKKRKLDHTPSQARFSADIDQAMIKAALDDQEAKRLAAIANHTAGDTHWVLNNALSKMKTTQSTTAPLKVVYVGYGDIDSSNESGDNEDLPVKGRASTLSRKSFGKKKSSEQGEADSGSDSSEVEDMDYDNDDLANRKSRKSSASSNAHRAESQSRPRSRQTPENSAAKQLRDKRKKKEVDLNKLTSISSGGGKKFGSQDSPNSRAKTCYNCQQPGHFAADCPKRSAAGNTRKY